MKFSPGCSLTRTARYCRMPLPNTLQLTHTHTRTSADINQHEPLQTCLTVSDSASPQPAFSPHTHTLRHVLGALTLGLRTVANSMVWFERILMLPVGSVVFFQPLQRRPRLPPYLPLFFPSCKHVLGLSP